MNLTGPRANGSPLSQWFSGESLQREADRYWLRWTLLAWMLVLGILLWQRSANVHWLALGDTDDNMRLMQVRAWLAGQGWYDLRQYRMNPPAGFDIHWSRLVDLPIAGIIVLLRPFLGTAEAERIACGIAPVLPLSIAMVAMALTIRRLVDRLAWPIALVILTIACGSTMTMFVPMRIDHHGWQLACLAVTVAGLCDPRRGRGGTVVGASCAVSLTIGLEMLPYCVMAGAIQGLRWAWDRDEARRLAAYGATLAGGSAFGFAVFASDANQAMRCDALTPVWLSTFVAAGAVLVLLAVVNPRALWLRVLLGVVASAVLAGAFAHFFPQCLGRPEGVSDELAKTWLNNVREAKPIYKHPWRNGVPMAVLPIIGALGGLGAIWSARRSDRLVGWVAVTLFTTFAGLMLLWQMRAGPAAQLLAVPGAAWLVWTIVPWCLQHRSIAVRVAGSAAAFLIASGIFIGLLVPYLPGNKPDPRLRTINRASGRCSTFGALGPLDRLPPAVIFTHVDLGPRLITITHHDAVAGPYHRNGDAILDVHHAFTGTPDQAHAIMLRHQAAYLMTCPNIAESTVYRSRNPNGFYAQLAKGTTFPWLEPMPLPKGSPIRLWRIR